MAKRISKSKQAAVAWVQDLMEHLGTLDRLNKRTSAAVARLLRAGCATTVNNGEPEWEDTVVSYPDLDTGEALLALSNRAAWNADQGRWSLEDVYKEFPWEMTNAINDLRLRWRERQELLNKQIGAAPGGFNRAVLITERDTIHRCVTELVDDVDSVKPRPLNEASTEKLYRWADRMVRVFDLMQEARRGPDPYDPLPWPPSPSSSATWPTGRS